MKICLALSKNKKIFLNKKKINQAGKERYNAFKTVFENNLRVVFVDEYDLEQINAPVYRLNNELIPSPVEENFSFDIFLNGGTSPYKDTDMCPTKKDIQKQAIFYSKAINQGKIVNIINNVEAFEKETKSIISEFKNNLNVPKTYFCDSPSDLEDAIKREKHIVAKHQYGEDGNQVYLLNTNNFEKWLQGKDLINYAFQQMIEHTEERRLIFYDNQVLGARTIIDRTLPWEKTKEKRAAITRQHKLQKYSPTEYEIKDTLYVANKLGFELGCVDWIIGKDEKRYLLEVNGVGTGFGWSGGVYNLNQKVAELIKEKYG